MLNFPFIVFFLFTCLQTINLHIVMFNRNNKITSAFLLFGIVSVIVHFILYINVLDYSYSDDLLQYSKWYLNVSKLDDIAQIEFEDKDPGFSYLLYMISLFTSSFGQVIFILSVYIVLFNLFLARYVSNEGSFNNQIKVFFLLLTIILFNRLSLGQYTNSIRSFVCGSMLIFCYLKYLDKKYIWLLLLPGLFLIHKFQFIIFFILLIGFRFMPLKLLIVCCVVGVINLPIGALEAFITLYIIEYIDVLKTIYSSRIISDEMRFTWARKFQIISLLIIPLVFMIRATTKNWIFNKSVNEVDKNIIKFTLFSVTCFLFLVGVLPAAPRILIFVFPLLYVMFIKYCSRNIIYGFSLLSILLGFVAVQRNLDNLIL